MTITTGSIIPEKEEEATRRMSDFMTITTGSIIAEKEEEATRRRKRDNVVLSIATFPRSRRHVVALWSQLECLLVKSRAQSTDTTSVVHDTNTNISTAAAERKRTTNDTLNTARDLLYSKLIISAADTSQEIIQQILQKAQQDIPHLNQTEIYIKFQINDRYDTGLWCDGLREAPQEYMINRRALSHQQMSHYFHNQTVVLSNDSIFLLRPSAEIVQVLQQQLKDMVSINYWGKEEGDSADYWLESTIRAFSPQGTKTFFRHSCQNKPVTHPWYCKGKRKRKKKRCLVDNFEIAMSRQFNRSQVHGLYPAKVPKGFGGYIGWIGNQKYWKRILRDQMDFPIAKVKTNWFPVTDTSLESCTKYLDMNWLDQLLQDKKRPRHFQ